MPNALVVIDVQNYFVNNKTRSLPKKIAAFIKHNKFDYVLFSQFVNKRNSNFVKLLKWNKGFKSPDIDIHKDLIPFVKKGQVFKKPTYSVFKSVAFRKFVKDKKITDLYLCGIDIDGCVLASVFDAFDLGYKVKVLKRLSMSHSYDHLDKAAQLILKQNLHQ